MDYKGIVENYLANIYSEARPSEIHAQYDYWLEGKDTLQKLFLGGKDKVSFEVDLLIEEGQLLEKLNRMLYSVSKEFGHTFRIDKVFYLIYKMLADLVAVHGSSIIVNNKFPKDVSYNSAYITLSFQSGMKITKGIFKEISRTLDNEIATETLNRYSMIIQKSRTKEEMWISTRPEDLITISENSLGWGSCMGTNKTYEYKLGLVEYMSNPRVAVAYLKSNSKPLPNGVDNKKWRSMIYLGYENESDTVIVELQKPYPYNSKLLLDSITWYFDSLGTVQRCNAPDRFDLYYPTHAYRDPNKKTLFYNPVVAIEADLNDLNTSGDYECPICGSFNICPCFGNYTECADCGEQQHEDDMYSSPDGLVCEACFERFYFYCEGCDMVHDRDYSYITADGEIVCEDCARNYYEFCEQCDELVHSDEMAEDGVCSYCASRH